MAPKDASLETAVEEVPRGRQNRQAPVRPPDLNLVHRLITQLPHPVP